MPAVIVTKAFTESHLIKQPATQLMEYGSGWDVDGERILNGESFAAFGYAGTSFGFLMEDASTDASKSTHEWKTDFIGTFQTPCSRVGFSRHLNHAF